MQTAAHSSIIHIYTYKLVERKKIKKNLFFKFFIVRFTFLISNL